MSDNSESDDSTEQQDHEQWQYEHSAELSEEFTDKIRSLVESFDFDNDDEDYIAGMATLDLWCKLTAMLGEIGYEHTELESMISEYLYLDQTRILH